MELIKKTAPSLFPSSESGIDPLRYRLQKFIFLPRVFLRFRSVKKTGSDDKAEKPHSHQTRKHGVISA